MARILEHNSKELLSSGGIPVPEGSVALTPEEAADIAGRIGYPVVIKALVPTGKRGKAGAISFASEKAGVMEQAGRILGIQVSYFPVEKLLVEKKLPVKQELYLSITIDKARRMPVLIAGSVGGIDIEQLSREHPDRVSKVYPDPFRGLPTYRAVEMWSTLGFNGNVLRQIASVTVHLYRAFCRYDATILEVNPLVITGDDQVFAAAAVLNIDESALFRQPDLRGFVTTSDRAWRPLTDLEKHMVAVNEADSYRGTARYTEMDSGDIGFMCGGGGASLLLMDALIRAGGRPANYSEVGGNPTESKVFGLCKGILSREGVKGFFLAHNITSNTQIDVVARGVVGAFTDLKIDPARFPVLVREAGTYDAEGRRIFEEAGIEYHGDDITLTEAAQLMVRKMRSFYPDYDQ